MTPEILHADMTRCDHEGKLRADDRGVLCPAGRPVTHVLINGKMLTLDEAIAPLVSLGKTIADALNPAITQLAEWAGRAIADPALHVIGAAAAALTQEREREASQ